MHALSEISGEIFWMILLSLIVIYITNNNALYNNAHKLECTDFYTEYVKEENRSPDFAGLLEY